MNTRVLNFNKLYCDRWRIQAVGLNTKKDWKARNHILFTKKEENVAEGGKNTGQ